MQLHILSDLHIEHEDFEPPDTGADAVVLAGDIGVGPGGLAWIASRFNHSRPLIYVPGNHEYYRHDLSLCGKLIELAPPHVHVLNNRAFTIGNVRFLGATLWTDFLLYGEAGRQTAMALAGQWMNDFELVGYKGRTFTPANSIALHNASREWLQARLDEPFDGKTVIVTHHLPSSRSVSTRFSANPLSPAFASDLESMMDGERVALWIHGHSHTASDYDVKGTRVLCNPRGYPRERSTTGFQPDLVVEL